MSIPKISIVTACYNDLEELKKTVESIIRQEGIDLNDWEYLIVDNESKDGTNEYVENLINAHSSDKIYYIREKDRGIYDAMNKGLFRAKGEWIYFLNAGDVFHDKNVLKLILEEICDTVCDVIYGNVYKYNQWVSKVQLAPDICFISDDMVLCHQGIIFNRNVHLKYPYDLKYKIAADYDSTLKMYLDGKLFRYIDIIIADFNMEGLSSQRIDLTFKEVIKVRKDNGVYHKTVLSGIIYICGLWKRKILMMLPQNFRWKIKGLISKNVD